MGQLVEALEAAFPVEEPAVPEGGEFDTEEGETAEGVENVAHMHRARVAVVGRPNAGKSTLPWLSSLTN